MEVTTKRIMEVTKDLYQWEDKGTTKEYFIFYSSFDLNSSDEYAKDFGDYFIVMVKPVIRGSANKPART